MLVYRCMDIWIYIGRWIYMTLWLAVSWWLFSSLRVFFFIIFIILYCLRVFSFKFLVENVSLLLVVLSSSWPVSLLALHESTIKQCVRFWFWGSNEIFYLFLYYFFRCICFLPEIYGTSRWVRWLVFFYLSRFLLLAVTINAMAIDIRQSVW